MERDSQSRFRTIVKVLALAGGLVIAARLYLALLPHSPAFGAMIVVVAGAVVAFSLLPVDRRIEELRSDTNPAESPPGF